MALKCRNCNERFNFVHCIITDICNIVTGIIFYLDLYLKSFYETTIIISQPIIEALDAEFISVPDKFPIVVSVSTLVAILALLVAAMMLGYKYRGIIKVVLYTQFGWHPFDRTDDTDVVGVVSSVPGVRQGSILSYIYFVWWDLQYSPKIYTWINLLLCFVLLWYCSIKIHLPLGKMAIISHTIFSEAFSWMKNFVFW